MSVTLLDIAKKTGVTRTTVSMVLGEKSYPIRVSEETRKKVLEAAREMNYVPSLTAKSLARGKTNTLGLIVGDISLPFFSEATSCFLHETETRGYHLLISVTEFDPAKELKCLDMLLQRRVDGILNFTNAVRPGVPQYEYIVKNKFPLIPLQEQEGLEEFSCVLNDWSPGMEEAVAYLHDKKLSRIGFVQLDYGKDIAGRFDRLTVFSEACRRRGIEEVRYSTEADMASVFDLGRRVARDPDRPEGLVVFSDYIAMGIISGLGSEGVRVPDDISIIGCDGTRAGAYFNPPLTSIAQDLATIAREGVRLVMERVEDRDLPPRTVTVPSKLIVRRSA